MIKTLPYFLAIVSGLLFGLAWNPLIPSFSLFFAFIPILFIIQNTKNHYSKVFSLSFFCFLIFHIATVWWLYQSSFLGILIIILLNSFFMAVVVVISFFTWKKFGSYVGILSFVIYWLSFEYIHYFWGFSWPFMNLGNWLGQIPENVQWYEYTGVLGGTFWILTVNVLLFSIIKFVIARNIRNSILLFLVLGLIFLGPLFLSIRIFNNYKEEGLATKIKIIQPNINPYSEKYNSKLFKNQIINQINIALEDDSTKFQCCIFPESSFPVYLNEQSMSKDSLMLAIDKQLIGNTGISVLGGLYSFKVEGRDSLFYNTAFMLNSNIQVYHKSKLVIGVEKMPFQEYLHFLKKLNLDLGGYTSSLTADNQRNVFYSDDSSLCIAPIICYESIYGQFVSDYIKEGATSIAVITNDGWWNYSQALEQILMHSQLRAIETRKSVARAANTGISCFINQKGEIVSQTKPGEQNYLLGTVQQNNKKTFYTKNGDFIGKISLYASIIILVFSLFIYVKERAINK